MKPSQKFLHCYKTSFSLTYHEKAFVLILLILVASCSARKKNTLETSGLKGAIKSIRTSTHDAYEAFGEPKYENSILAFSLVWKSVYNRDGDLIESNVDIPLYSTPRFRYKGRH